MAQKIVTYADLINRCRRFLRTRGVPVVDGDDDQDMIRSSIHDGIAELIGRRVWTRYRRITRIALVAPYATGTIAYDHTGGTHERMVTLTSGTWPSWAVHGELVISSVSYRVADRKSNSIITLDPHVNPGADVASGTSYSLHRAYYTLPSNFVKMGEPQLATSWGRMIYITPDKWLSARTSSATTTGTPCNYTFMGDPSVLNNLAIYLFPVPNVAEGLEIPYIARPRPLVYAGNNSEECQGFITCTLNSPAITGEGGTDFEANMAGSILRIGKNAVDFPGGLDSAHPRTDERTVISVASTTALTVDAGVNTTFSTGVKYSISDPVDFDPGLIPCLQRCIEKHLGFAYGLRFESSRGGSVSIQPELERAYEQAFELAQQEDDRSYARRCAGGGYEPRSWGYTVDAEVS